MGIIIVYNTNDLIFFPLLYKYYLSIFNVCEQNINFENIWNFEHSHRYTYNVTNNSSLIKLGINKKNKLIINISISD